MPTALVTGVAGFIGSSLAAALLDGDYTVRGIDNFATGSRQNIASLENQSWFSFTELDIRDADGVG